MVKTRELTQSLQALISLYGRLHQSEKRKVELYLEGRLEAVQELESEESEVLTRIRQMQDRLDLKSSTGLDGLGDPALRDCLRRLKQVIEELACLNLRNRRFLNASMYETGEILKEVFPEPSNYSGQGYSQPRTSRPTGDGAGIRV